MRVPTRNAVALAVLLFQLLLPLVASAAIPVWPGFGDLCSARVPPVSGGTTSPAHHRSAHDFAHCPMCASGVACATPPFAASLPAAESAPPRALPAPFAGRVSIARRSLPAARGPPATT
ncbi:MAG: DUF2946 family protein [Casimicrobiaceae bacterium]